MGLATVESGKDFATKQLLTSEQTGQSSKVGVGRADGGDPVGGETEEMRRVAERLMDGMLLGEMLGYGSYGRVYKGKGEGGRGGGGQFRRVMDSGHVF